MSSTASVGGLISGLDTNSILDQLSAAARAPITRLEQKKQTLQTQSAAWSQLEAFLLRFRTAAVQLASPADLDVKTATVSRPSMVTASPTAAAAAGTYLFWVDSLAQTHQLASQGYADVDHSEVGSGTVSIAVGGANPVVIQTDGLTLAELRDAINAADAGVTAAIINDGSREAPYRLVLTSQTSGLDGQMEVQVSLAGGQAPIFSQLQAAQNAQLRLGSGPGAIIVSSPKNAISDAIPGVTLQLLDADPTAPVTITVAADVQTLQARIDEFVDAYNQIADFVAQQFSYDAETEQAGTLFADFSLQSLQHELISAVTQQVTGLGGLASLSALGIRLDSSGKLVQTKSAVAEALRNNAEDVLRLFAAVGTTSDPRVTYLGSTRETAPSGPGGWAVEITQAARQARVTAGVAQTEPLSADETLIVQGVSIHLSAGMTQAEVIDAINAYQQQTGVTASATGADGEGVGAYLTLTRTAYGSAFHLSASSSRSSALAGTTGLGNVVVTDSSPGGESGTGTGHGGLDVAGTIGGQRCTGSGQRLTAQSGDPAGICLLVSGNQTGSRGTVVFTVGVGEAAFRAAVASAAPTGALARAQERISDTTRDLDQEIARLEDLVSQEQERLRTTFARMEEALGRFQSQSQFLAAQFAQMRANSSAKAS